MKEIHIKGKSKLTEKNLINHYRQKGWKSQWTK